MRVKIAILGSTGYLGEQILEVLTQRKDFETTLISGYSKEKRLKEQARELNVPYAFNPRGKRSFWANSSTCLITDYELLEEIILNEIEGVFFAASGIEFLDLFWKLMDTSHTLWVASKEVIILAGELKSHLLKGRENLIPLDSEHNALWQMFKGVKREEVSRIYLTASGGAFYEWQGRWDDITPEMALAHPNWKMGAKITIDSANLINKGLEVIEASSLFGFDVEEIEVVVQRESFIHALIELRDGFSLALLSPPDMRSVILNAISKGKREENPFQSLDFSQIKSLSFSYPVPEKFVGFYLAREASRKGKGYAALFCGADEALVRAFLSREICFGDIPLILERVLEQEISPPESLEKVKTIYHQGYRLAQTLVLEGNNLQ
ncbi:MAG: 1-deoxy-D-xylulose-5-phosphate reductoisomerase [Candidatus Atribacteria bacterium]|nr:1-deoxy-D-xylulose-5-phosphate reductoisomerase [Candidatus Atribacteria bacterium]